MVDLLLKNAQVIDIDDSEKKGRIKIRVLPELEGVEDVNLPFAIPFGIDNLSDSTSENDLPLIGSVIRVLVDKYWQRFYYLKGNRYFQELFDYNKIDTKLNKVSEISNEYKDLKFRLYDDGGLEFHNKKTGSHGFVHKSGSYSIFDDKGNIILNGGSTNKVKIYNDLADMKTIIMNMRDILEKVITPMNLVTPQSPVAYKEVTVDLPKIIETKVLIENLLK